MTNCKRMAQTPFRCLRFLFFGEIFAFLAKIYLQIFASVVK